jgi:hypothetical protein
METPTMNRRRSAKAASLTLAGLAVMCLLCVATVATPVSKASGTDIFCKGVTLPPYGTYGDHCYAWEWEAQPLLAVVGITTFSRAGCVTSAAGSGYDLKESWYCVGKESTGSRYVSKTTESRRGVIRNNNLTYSGTFTGFVSCCWSP